MIDGDRTSEVAAASDGDAIVGVVGQGPVKKNNREPMVEITNNAPSTVSYTVSLDTCSDGTLYDNAGGSGCSVTFSLSSGNSRMLDIDADVTGTIPYSISASGDGLSLDTTGSVESESGNVASDILIQKPTKDQDFTAVPPQGNSGNVFEIKSVDIRDDDGDNSDDLDKVEYEIQEAGTGDVVGSKAIETFDGNETTDRYNPNGNPAETIEPNDGYTIEAGTLYRLTTTGTHTNGNFDSETVEDTA